jgi:beta-glucanase (GH16 family)
VLQKANQGNGINIPDASDAFHVYAVEWDAEHMDFFVDSQKYFTYRNEKTGPDAWPFDKAQYLKLNLAIGGGWGGQQGIDDSIFPQRFYINYVRVYQKEP